MCLVPMPALGMLGAQAIGGTPDPNPALTISGLAAVDVGDRALNSARPDRVEAPPTKQ